MGKEKTGEDIPIWNVTTFSCQSRYYISKSRKRSIYILCFLKSFPLSLSLCKPLTTCQIHKPKLALGTVAIQQIFSLYCYTKHAEIEKEKKSHLDAEVVEEKDIV